MVRFQPFPLIAINRHISILPRTKGVFRHIKSIPEKYSVFMLNLTRNVFGCSTWGEGDLQDDFVDFHEAMEGISSVYPSYTGV